MHTPPWPLTRAPRRAALLRLAAGLGLARGTLRPLLAALDALPAAATAVLPPALAPGRAGGAGALPAAALAAACRACQALAVRLRLIGCALSVNPSPERKCQAVAAWLRPIRRAGPAARPGRCRATLPCPGRRCRGRPGAGRGASGALPADAPGARNSERRMHAVQACIGCDFAFEMQGKRTCGGLR